MSRLHITLPAISALLGLSLGAAPALAAPPPTAGNGCVSAAHISDPQPLPSAALSTVPPAIQQLRRQMLDPGINEFTFHEMDKIFTTRTVLRSGPVWQLPTDLHPMNFTYQHDGHSYNADAIFERDDTNALLIMKDGKIVTEVYRNYTTPQTRFVSWSMAKSITSMLVGIAIEDGYIKSIDDKITKYLPELSHGGYAQATIRQIMEMRSGVDYEERYDFSNPGIAARNHETSLVENVTRFADAARTVKSKYPPGQVFQYKTLDTAVLGWLVERATGMNAASFMTSRIWGPLGAESDGFFLMDGPKGVGREFTGAGFNATLRDYARLGQMVLNGGMANDHQIVPQAWIKLTTSPTTPAIGGHDGYGYQWWMMPNSHAFAAIGLQGQYIYVDPDTKTVVVKLSYFPPGDNAGYYQEAEDFMRAASAWHP